MALLIIMKVVPLVVVGLALLVAVRAQDEESQESKDAAEAKEPKASAGPSKLAPTNAAPQRDLWRMATPFVVRA